MVADHPYNKTGWESYYVDSKSFRFGKTDLAINGNLDNCSSTLESSFGCSFRRPVRSTILAGAEKFRINQMEVFYVQNNPQQNFNQYGNMNQDF